MRSRLQRWLRRCAIPSEAAIFKAGSRLWVALFRTLFERTARPLGTALNEGVRCR